MPKIRYIRKRFSAANVARMSAKNRKALAIRDRERRRKRGAKEALLARQQLVARTGRNWKDVKRELPKIEHGETTGSGFSKKRAKDLGKQRREARENPIARRGREAEIMGRLRTCSPNARSKIRRAPCHYCGKDPAGTVDHVIPLSKGGPNRLSNIVPCCHECNGEKGDKPYEWFVAWKRRELETFDRQMKALEARIEDAKRWSPDVVEEVGQHTGGKQMIRKLTLLALWVALWPLSIAAVASLFIEITARPDDVVLIVLAIVSVIVLVVGIRGATMAVFMDREECALRAPRNRQC